MCQVCLGLRTPPVLLPRLLGLELLIPMEDMEGGEGGWEAGRRHKVAVHAFQESGLLLRKVR